MKTRALILPLLVLAIGVATPAGARRESGHTWARPGVLNYPLRRIALLPVASSAPLSDELLELIGEDVVLDFLRVGRELVPPEMTHDYLVALSRDRSDSLARAVATQIARHGRPDSTGVPRIARVLRSQALLSIRIDRWERTSDASLAIAHVEMAATLVDSAGHVLWQASGDDLQRTRYGVPQTVGLEVPNARAQPYSSGFSAVGGDVDGRTGGNLLGPHRNAATPNAEKTPSEISNVVVTTGSGKGVDFALAFNRIMGAWLAGFPAWPVTGALSSATGSASH